MNLKGRVMRVKGSFTTTTEVNVSPDDALWALRVEVLRIKGIDVNAYIDDKKRLVKNEDQWTSHSWTETVVLNENPGDETVDLIKAFELIERVIQNKRYYGTCVG
jgi:hypothetical protein